MLNSQSAHICKIFNLKELFMKNLVNSVLERLLSDEDYKNKTMKKKKKKEVVDSRESKDQKETRRKTAKKEGVEDSKKSLNLIKKTRRTEDKEDFKTAQLL